MANTRQGIQANVDRTNLVARANAILRAAENPAPLTNAPIPAARTPVGIFANEDADAEVEHQEVHKKANDAILAHLDETIGEDNYGYALGEAISEGDCFFDAVGQGLASKGISIPGYQGESVYKKLRQLCKALANQLENAKNNQKPQTNIKNWLDEELAKDSENVKDYIKDIEFTAPEMQTRYDQKLSTHEGALWGRPQIDGRFICAALNIKLHVVEIMTVENEVIISHYLIDKNGSQPCNEESIQSTYDDARTIHLAVYQHTNHFVPILKQKVEHQQSIAQESDEPGSPIATEAEVEPGYPISETNSEAGPSNSRSNAESLRANSTHSESNEPTKRSASESAKEGFFCSEEQIGILNSIRIALGLTPSPGLDAIAKNTEFAGIATISLEQVEILKKHKLYHSIYEFFLREHSSAAESNDFISKWWYGYNESDLKSLRKCYSQFVSGLYLVAQHVELYKPENKPLIEVIDGYFINALENTCEKMPLVKIPSRLFLEITAAKISTIDELPNGNVEIVSPMMQLSRENIKLKHENKILKDKRDSPKNEKNNPTDKGDLGGENIQLNKEKDSLKVQNSTLKEENARLKIMIAALKKENTTLKQRVEELEVNLEAHKSIIDGLVERMDRMEQTQQNVNPPQGRIGTGRR